MSYWETGMKNSLNIKFTNAQILTASVMLIALASLSYQVMILRKKNKNAEYKEVIFIYPEE